MYDLPCIKCICFAVCKDSVPMRNSGTALMGHIQNELITKCSLLNDFIYFSKRTGEDNYTTSSGEQMYKVINYFRSKMKIK